MSGTPLLDGTQELARQNEQLRQEVEALRLELERERQSAQVLQPGAGAGTASESARSGGAEDQDRLRVEKLSSVSGTEAVLNHFTARTIQQMTTTTASTGWFKFCNRVQLAKEFWYDEQGTVFSKEPKDTMKFAKVVTMQSFHDDFAWVIIVTSFRISRVISQISFSVDLFWKEEYEKTDPLLKYLYVAILVVSLILWIGLASWTTYRELQAQQFVQDFVETGYWAKLRYLLSNFLFQMFNVPKDLRDAPILFHPRKAVQPYAAFRTSGARVSVFGWPTKQQHKYENRIGLFVQFPFSCMAAVPLMVLNACIAFNSFQSCFAMITTVISFAWNLWKARDLHKCRKVFKAQLTKAAKEGIEEIEGGTKMTDTRKREVVVQHKLLRKYFSAPLPRTVQELAAALGISIDPKYD